MHAKQEYPIVASSHLFDDLGGLQGSDHAATPFPEFWNALVRSESRRTRNSEMPDSLVEYCRAHPDQRFWQALRNWSGWQHVLVSNDSDFVLSKAAGWKKSKTLSIGKARMSSPGKRANRRVDFGTGNLPVSRHYWPIVMPAPRSDLSKSIIFRCVHRLGPVMSKITGQTL